jgi:hypothetical protein
VRPSRGMGDINPLKVPGRKPAKKLAKGGSVTALDKLVKAERATSRMGK